MRKTKTKTATYEVFHAAGEYFWTSLRYEDLCTAADIWKAFHGGEYEHVATFDLAIENLDFQLEYIFEKTNNIEEAWNKASPCRSTSVGDIVTVGDEVYVVAGTGYHQISEHGVIRSTA